MPAFRLRSSLGWWGEYMEEFKRGYRLGVERGREKEKRLALLLVLGFVLVFELLNAISLRFVC